MEAEGEVPRRGWSVASVGFRSGRFVDALDAGVLLGLFPRLDPRPGLMTALPEAIGVVAGFDDVAVMGEPVEQRGGELGVDEDVGPFGEHQVGGDDHAGVLVEP